MADINPEAIIYTIAESIKHKYEFIDILNSTLWYSRYYGGGYYTACCRVYVTDSTILALDRSKRVDRPASSQKFDLADPESFRQIGEYLRILFDETQPERKNRDLIALPEVTEYDDKREPSKATLESIRRLRVHALKTD
jgi:hypothetical protein